MQPTARVIANARRLMPDVLGATGTKVTVELPRVFVPLVGVSEEAPEAWQLVLHAAPRSTMGGEACTCWTWASRSAWPTWRAT
jgi:hypothetical protein